VRGSAPAAAEELKSPYTGSSPMASATAVRGSDQAVAVDAKAAVESVPETAEGLKGDDGNQYTAGRADANACGGNTGLSLAPSLLLLSPPSQSQSRSPSKPLPWPLRLPLLCVWSWLRVVE
jgi:hypothetical protein